MAKVTIYLPDELAERVKASGMSMSPVCQRALQEEVEKMQTTQGLKAREERIIVEVEGPGDATIDQAFYGTWLVQPDPEGTRTGEEYYDRDAYWGIALTRKGQIAVYVHPGDHDAVDPDKRWSPHLEVYVDLDAAADDVPGDIIGLAARELGEDWAIELDI